MDVPADYPAQLKKRIKDVLANQAIDTANSKANGLELARITIEIREKIRAEGRLSPTFQEADLLMMISEWASRLFTTEVKAPCMCLLTPFELAEFKEIVAQNVKVD